MTDITKCKGDGCPIKDKCYRYTAPWNSRYQSVFARIPYDKEQQTCTEYWEVDNE